MVGSSEAYTPFIGVTLPLESACSSYSRPSQPSCPHLSFLTASAKSLLDQELEQFPPSVVRHRTAEGMGKAYQVPCTAFLLPPLFECFQEAEWSFLLPPVAWGTPTLGDTVVGRAVRTDVKQQLYSTAFLSFSVMLFRQPFWTL